MQDELRCIICNKLVARLKLGTEWRKGAVTLCADCNKKRLANDMKAQFDSVGNLKHNPFSSIFG